MTGVPTRERPIIFSAPMIRAIHAGRKTMTRRVLRLPTKTHTGGAIYERPDMGGWEPTTNGGGGCFTIGKSGERVPVPETVGIWHRTCGVCLSARWQKGDLLWVREQFSGLSKYKGRQPRAWPPIDPIWYWADGNPPNGDWTKPKPSIHMPRWASRITLRVTAVRVERLQEISEEDAQAEGIYWSEESEGWTSGRNGHEFCDFHGAWATFSFRKLWNSLHGPDAWDANPWVSVTSFEREGMEVVDA